MHFRPLWIIFTTRWVVHFRLQRSSTTKKCGQLFFFCHLELWLFCHPEVWSGFAYIGIFCHQEMWLFYHPEVWLLFRHSYFTTHKSGLISLTWGFLPSRIVAVLPPRIVAVLSPRSVVWFRLHRNFFCHQELWPFYHPEVRWLFPT